MLSLHKSQRNSITKHSKLINIETDNKFSVDELMYKEFQKPKKQVEKSKSSRSFHLFENIKTSEIDKYFKEYLKCRKHNDYIEYKLSSIEKKPASKIAFNEPTALNDKRTMIQYNNIKDQTTAPLYMVNSRINLPYLDNTMIEEMAFKSLVSKTPIKKELQQRSSMKNYYEPIFLLRKSENKENILIKNRSNSYDQLRNNEPDYPIYQQEEILKSKTNDNQIEINNIDNSSLQIKLINNSNNKSQINSLRKSSKIKAIKMHHVSSESHDYVGNVVSNGNSHDGNSFGKKEEKNEVKIKIDSQSNKETFYDQANTADFNKTSKTNAQETSYCQNSSKDSSSNLASNIPILEPELLDSLDELQIGEDTSTNQKRNSIRLRISFNKTKSWIEGHQYFFNDTISFSNEYY